MIWYVMIWDEMRWYDMIWYDSVGLCSLPTMLSPKSCTRHIFIRRSLSIVGSVIIIASMLIRYMWSAIDSGNITSLFTHPVLFVVLSFPTSLKKSNALVGSTTTCVMESESDCVWWCLAADPILGKERATTKVEKIRRARSGRRKKIWSRSIKVAQHL